MAVKKFIFKSFISFLMFYTFIVLAITGIVLYIDPSSSYAYWVDWRLLGLSKGDWKSLHIVFSTLFLILAVIHIGFMNRRVILSYLKRKAVAGINRKFEFFGATIIFLIILLMTLFEVPPMKQFVYSSIKVAKMWEDPAKKAPIRNMEKMNLEQIAVDVMGSNIETVKKILTDQKIKIRSTKMPLWIVARENKLSPRGIYMIIKVGLK